MIDACVIILISLNCLEVSHKLAVDKCEDSTEKLFVNKVPKGLKFSLQTFENLFSFSLSLMYNIHTHHKSHEVSAMSVCARYDVVENYKCVRLH